MIRVLSWEIKEALVHFPWAIGSQDFQHPGEEEKTALGGDQGGVQLRVGSPGTELHHADHRSSTTTRQCFWLQPHYPMDSGLNSILRAVGCVFSHVQSPLSSCTEYCTEVLQLLFWLEHTPRSGTLLSSHSYSPGSLSQLWVSTSHLSNLRAICHSTP